ncbi:TetR/AcrR family transcriptional regulator [Streptomyces albipurpureus]|uniref:WHG domain-containing protein n=1 Tax=Streptomyces albipurpureus TaxID=2897419 RepID=A0ABT0UMN2_9ACTN|nr:WHG domain-containing protein [Streptomyces sp. CWNU-1]MCM2389884.1 WHG domain-containing protein [Streptomyces sp. CWNU-1]
MSQVGPGRTEQTRPTLNRRERLRQSTLEEIVEVGRSLLSAGREVTLRAVAAEMGFTAPALYRYVGSVAALNELLSDDIFAEIVREMAAAAEPYGDNDPAAQMVAAATTFRYWALDHIDEFQLVFHTNSLSGEHVARSEAGQSLHPLAPASAGSPAGGVQMFADFFGRIFMNLAQQNPFPLPAREELDEDFVAVHSPAEEGKPDLAGLLGRDGLGLLWLFELSWAQLYGIVTLEVFGHVRPQLVKSGALFAAVMREIGHRAGMAGDWPRLAAVSQQVRARRE